MSAELPADLKYTAEHEWVNTAAPAWRVGITDFAQEQLGSIVYVQLPAVGDTITAGETCGEVESTKSVSDIYAPVSGVIRAVNESLDDSPETVNSDAYGAGWLFEVEPSDAAASEGLLDAGGYQSVIDGSV